MTTIGFIVLRGTRIVIPSELREHMLKLAHEGHPGIVMMKKRLRSKVWWPGIDKDSKRFCKECYGCQLVSKPIAPESINLNLGREVIFKIHLKIIASKIKHFIYFVKFY